MNYDDINVVLTAGDIAVRIGELAERITRDYEGKKLLVVAVMKSSLPFVADLIRSIGLPLSYELVLFHPADDEPFEFTGAADGGLSGYDVLVADSLIESGSLMYHICDELERRGADSVTACALIDVSSKRTADIIPGYTGFSLPAASYVGYGLDKNEEYRNLPFIAAV